MRLKGVEIPDVWRGMHSHGRRAALPKHVPINRGLRG
jgi:hypothetical protein